MKKQKKMSKKYFLKYREGMFPWIKDFTTTQNELRHTKNVKEMTYKEWFWFHPTAYHLLSYGINWIGILTFGSMLMYTVSKGLLWLSVIPALALFINGKAIFVKRKQKSLLKEINFYDIYIRDYFNLEVRKETK